jgi:heme oxygenase
MSLKELTADKHAEAEATPFMKAVFAGKMTPEIWIAFTYQKHAFYKEIEDKADMYGLLEDLPGIKRADLILQDCEPMLGRNITYAPTQPVYEYCAYIRSLHDPVRIMAHLYTWHMGDMFGGQMIKKIIDAPSSHLDFENAAELKTTIRSKLTDDMADEANVAFDWAIKILNHYEF